MKNFTFDGYKFTWELPLQNGLVDICDVHHHATFSVPMDVLMAFALRVKSGGNFPPALGEPLPAPGCFTPGQEARVKILVGESIAAALGQLSEALAAQESQTGDMRGLRGEAVTEALERVASAVDATEALTRKTV